MKKMRNALVFLLAAAMLFSTPVLASADAVSATATAQGLDETVTVTVTMEDGKITGVEASTDKEEVTVGAQALEQLPAESKKLRVAAALLEPQNLKRLGVAAAGSAAVLGLTASAIRTRLYRRALARELKRQLAPINKKLDALEKQNKELMEQNEQLKKKLS
jgi:hypothetical protein